MAGKDAAAPALLEEVSTSGVRVIVRRCYEPGRVLAVSRRYPADGPKCTLLAHVVHARNQGGGNWIIGCAWLNALTEKDVDALL